MQVEKALIIRLTSGNILHFSGGAWNFDGYTLTVTSEGVVVEISMDQISSWATLDLCSIPPENHYEACLHTSEALSGMSPQAYETFLSQKYNKQ